MVVCICGSMRYYNRMLAKAEQLTELGYIVLMPFCVKGDAHLAVSLDALHREKIDLAAEVLVVGSYVGDSTAAEIAYAEAAGKPVRRDDGS